jgi:hypothetical protein
MYRHLVSEKLHEETSLIICSKQMKHKNKLEGETRVLGSQIIKNPRKFCIVLNILNGRRAQLLTLAHELVHMKQYAKNQLGSCWWLIADNKITYHTTWKKKVFNENKKHYFDLPWEIEANGREYGLYFRYRKFIKKYKVKFKEDKV